MQRETPEFCCCSACDVSARNKYRFLVHNLFREVRLRLWQIHRQVMTLGQLFTAKGGDVLRLGW